jgi:membrane protein
MDNKKNGSEQKTRLILLCVILFIGEFAWFLLGRHNAEPISANDIIRAILFAVVALPVVILIFYHPLVKNFFNRDYRKNTTDDVNRATGSEKFIFGQTSFAKTMIIAFVLITLSIFAYCLLRKNNISALSTTDILRMIGISVIGAIVVEFMFLYLPAKAQYNLYKGQSKRDFFKSKEYIIGTVIAGTFLIFLFSVLMMFGMYGLAVQGHVAELTEDTSNQILYSKIPYGVIFFVAGEFLLYLYLRNTKRKYKYQ